jgi:uncharacterized membrane protein YbhN (UPF0104 family)
MPGGSPAKRALRIAGGLALLAVVGGFVGPEQLLAALRGVHPGTYALAVLVSILSNLLSAVRWAYIARALGLTAPTAQLVPMYARAMTSNTLLPGATVSGDLLRSYELSRLGNPLLESTASVGFDRLSGLWTLCVLSLIAAAIAAAGGIALPHVERAGTVLWTYGVALGAITVAPFLPWPVRTLRRLSSPLAHRLADLWDRLHDPRSGLRRRLVRSLGLSFGVQVLSASALAIGARALGVEGSWTILFAAAAPIFLMASLPLGIAGFGTRELAAVAVLGVAGVPADLAAGTGLLYGICGVIQGVLAAPMFLARR